MRVRRADGSELYWQHRGKILGQNRAEDESENERENETETDETETGENKTDETETAFDAPVKLLGMCLDITARKVAERARRRTETRLSRIAETAADAIMLYDANGNIIFANDAAARVFGRPIEELWSLSYDDLQWGDTRLDGTPAATGRNRISPRRARAPAGFTTCNTAWPSQRRNGRFCRSTPRPCPKITAISAASWPRFPTSLSSAAWKSASIIRRSTIR